MLSPAKGWVQTSGGGAAASGGRCGQIQREIDKAVSHVTARWTQGRHPGPVGKDTSECALTSPLLDGAGVGGNQEICPTQIGRQI